MTRNIIAFIAIISLFSPGTLLRPSVGYSAPKDIKISITRHPKCSANNRPKTLSLVVTNNSGYPVRVDISTSEGEAFNQSTKVKKKQRKIVTLKKNRLPKVGGAMLQFDFIPLDRSGSEIESLPIIRKSHPISQASNTCVSVIAFKLGEKTYGEPPKPSLNYGAFIRDGDYTCCLEADGKPTYKLQYGQEASIPDGAIILMSGFPSTAAMFDWICNRPVYYHYWASNWAWFGGYRVSSLPCKINQ